jgi:hypothetical protein
LLGSYEWTFVPVASSRAFWKGRGKQGRCGGRPRKSAGFHGHGGARMTGGEVVRLLLTTMPCSSVSSVCLMNDRPAAATAAMSKVDRATVDNRELRRPGSARKLGRGQLTTCLGQISSLFLEPDREEVRLLRLPLMRNIGR